MMIASQLGHPELSLPVHRIRLLAACTTFLDNPTLVSSLYPVWSSVDVDNFRRFVDAMNQAPLDIADANTADLSSLAIGFGFVRLLRQVEGHDPRFPVPRSATWHCKDLPQLIDNLHDAIPPGRNESGMNLTCPLLGLAGNRSPEVHQTSCSLVGHKPPMGPGRKRGHRGDGRRSYH
jgi:hypothetical protein